LKGHLSLRYDVIADIFLTRVPRRHTWETDQYSEAFGIFVNCQMEIPVFFTRTVPEFNTIIDAFMEELS